MGQREWRYRVLVPQSQIGYVRAIVEAYEGVAQVSSAAGCAEMEWIASDSMREQAEALLSALEAEIGLRRLT